MSIFAGFSQRAQAAAYASCSTAFFINHFTFNLPSYLFKVLVNQDEIGCGRFVSMFRAKTTSKKTSLILPLLCKLNGFWGQSITGSPTNITLTSNTRRINKDTLGHLKYCSKICLQEKRQYYSCKKVIFGMINVKCAI